MEKIRVDAGAGDIYRMFGHSYAFLSVKWRCFLYQDFGELDSGRVVDQ